MRRITYLERQQALFYSSRGQRGASSMTPLILLANVNSRSRSLYAIARPSVVCRLAVVCNVRAPYSGG